MKQMNRKYGMAALVCLLMTVLLILLAACNGDNPADTTGELTGAPTEEITTPATTGGSLTLPGDEPTEPSVPTDPTEPTEPVVDGGDQSNTGADVADPDKTADKGEGNGNSSTMLIVSIIATVVVLAGGGVAVYFIMKKDKKEETAEAEEK